MKNKKNVLPVMFVAATLTIISCKKSGKDLAVSANKESMSSVPVVNDLADNEINELIIPTAVTIEAHTQRGCPTSNSCYFIASGAFNDAGTIIISDFLHENALYSPVVGTFQWTRTFIGEHGSITIRLQSSVHVPEEPCVLNEAGHWIIIAGTGDYAGLQGEGDESGIRNPCESKLDAVYNGLVH
ncbi:MAG TPA: hypothetical protein VFU29_15070 [Chitinophagaceae bacterium]|nr:hypothetical protein [Chitinophagaceae bacterium]